MNTSIFFKPWMSLLALAFFLVGCANTASIPKGSELDYGPPPSDVEEVVRAYMNHYLKDPFSAHIEVGTPFEGYTRKAPIQGGGIAQAGWVVPVRVNAKNSFGAYTGWKQMNLLVRSRQVLMIIPRNPFFKEPWLHGDVQ